MVTLKLPNWNVLKTTSHKQLELQLFPLERFLTNYIDKPPSPPPPNDVPTAEKAKTLVEKAIAELDKRNVQNAWALYYNAELLRYKLMDDNELKARAGKILFTDTRLLDDGEKKCIRKLLGEDAGNGDWNLKAKPDRNDVIEARRMVQDYYSRKYTFLGLALAQLSLLAFVAGLVSLIIIAVLVNVPSNNFAFDSLSAANFEATNVTATDFNATNFQAANFTATNIVASNPSQISSANWLFWITVGFFGALGGSISGLYGLKQAFSSETDVPERILNKWITIAKPVVGFAAAIIIAIFLIGGLIQAANLTVSNYLMYAMGFISGFSERLIIGAVGERLPSSG